MKNSPSLVNVIIMHDIKSTNLGMRYRLDQQPFSSMLYLVSTLIQSSIIHIITYQIYHLLGYKIIIWFELLLCIERLPI